jgi:heterodisulfide reductase subunit A
MTNEDTRPQRNNAALVVGAGIGGMQSALLLAEAGHKVYLLDSAPGIGGSLHLLDRTFPTDSCGLCLMLPGRAAYCPTIECDLHRNIEILPYAELVKVQGEAGNFTATVRHKPRWVRVDLCNNCGLCAAVCPVERPDQYEGDLDRKKAIYRPPARAIPPAYVIDMDYCIRCGKCVAVCPMAAIELEMVESQSEISVGAVILSPGFKPFDARLKGEYGFGCYDNVLTSIQFERMISISGSTGAAILRPSDGRTPQRIAFIQCIGSRDDAIGRGYCSSVCCMVTAKQVAVAKRLQPDLNVTVFFMDIRAHGKDFDEYFNTVESLPGVTYRRCMPTSIHQYQQTRDLQLSYVAEDGSLQGEDFDLVVLSTGFAPPLESQKLGQALGIELNPYGFCATRTFTPDASSRPGILVSGAFREPKDIPETVVEASAVAASATRWLCSPSPTRGEEETEERDVSDEWPRVGVFLCNCRGEIGNVIDLEALTDHTRGLRDVTFVQTLDNACLGEGLRQIGQAVIEHGLNRAVIAGCAARLYQSAFEGMMRQAGLDAGLLERVNLRGECAWVHLENGKGAAAKARELVAMAVASARLRKSSETSEIPASQRVLVIGGGLAGMTAALSLAEMGHEVDLVEQSAELGGQLRELRYTLGGDDPAAFLGLLIKRVESNESIHVSREAQVEAVSGHAGQFRTTVRSIGNEPMTNEPTANDQRRETLEHGTIVVATGGHEVTPTEYLYGQDPRVVTQRQLEEMLVDWETSKLVTGKPAEGAHADQSTSLPTTNLPNTIVMIQCVGSREPERPYCSRVCCTKAVANALKIKEQNPEANVFVLYREMRTHGFREDAYRQARDEGVIFLRYELPAKPEVSADEEGLTVRLTEPITGEEITLRADVVALSVGIEPNDNRSLANVLDVPLDANGFFQEEYAKMRPLDFSRRGIFVCGLAHSPCAADETILQAQGAAMRAAALLAQKRLEAPAFAVQVNTRLCSACGLCVEICPFGARVLEPGGHYAEVIEVLCQGCGACAVACPNKATQQQGSVARQVYGMLDVVGVGE